MLYNKQCVAARRATSLKGLSRGRAFPFRVTPLVDRLPAFVVTFQFELEGAQLYTISVKRSYEECTCNWHVGRPNANSGSPVAPLLVCRCTNVME